MPKPFEQWTVLPHGKLTRLDDDLLTVVGDLPMPLVKFPRRMTVVRLADGGLVIYSAIALDEPEMQTIEALGTPRFLLVPGDIHRLDAKVWKQRYPQLSVVCPAGARRAVEQLVAVDSVNPDFGDSRVRFVTVPGTDGHEAALLVEGAQGTTLIVNDIIWNVGQLPGVGGWLFKVTGLTGPTPRVPSVVRLKLIKDKRALQKQLTQWAALPGLRRLVPSHGDIVDEGAPRVLQDLAASL